MKKIAIFILFFNILLASDEMLLNKIKNIIGKKTFIINQILIQDLIQKYKNIYINNKINYTTLLLLLKRNGLLLTKLNKPQSIEILFQFNNPKLGYKNIKDIIKELGITYYNTKYITQDNNLSILIEYKSDFILDPYIFNLELNKCNAKILDIKKTKNSWYYNIDFSKSDILKSIKIPINEEIRLKKPLKPYLLQIAPNSSKIKIINHRLNHWFPKILFFDKDLNMLKKVIKNRYYKGLTIKLPKNTKYILIDDVYNLLNIKRGMKITILNLRKI